MVTQYKTINLNLKDNEMPICLCVYNGKLLCLSQIPQDDNYMMFMRTINMDTRQIDTTLFSKNHQYISGISIGSRFGLIMDNHFIIDGKKLRLPFINLKPGLYQDDNKFYVVSINNCVYWLKEREKKCNLQKIKKYPNEIITFDKKSNRYYKKNVHNKKNMFIKKDVFNCYYKNNHILSFHDNIVYHVIKYNNKIVALTDSGIKYFDCNK